MDNIHKMQDENIFFTTNDKLFLETLLFEIRSKNLLLFIYSKKEKKEEQDLMKDKKANERNASEGDMKELSCKNNN